MQHLQPNITLQGGKYRIERMLGQGGFGITYLAELVSAHKRVAIKELFIANNGQAINGRNGNYVTVTNDSNQVVFDKHREKFKKEASRLATLHHKNLVHVYEWFEENGTAYYVMDFIEGESLRDKLNREGALPESLVMNYLQQLLSALQVVHEKNIWHLDIKPENIMVDRNNHVYLIDFGASKHIEQSSGTLTTSSMLAYTPGYFPPEQSAVTMKNIGAWTDIYALGATLYNLLTRRNPPTFDVIISEGRNAFSFPSSISSKTQDLIVRMMKLNRNERPQNVNDVLKKLDVAEGTRVVGSEGLSIIGKPKNKVGASMGTSSINSRRNKKNGSLLTNILGFMALAVWFIGIPLGLSMQSEWWSPIVCWSSGMGGLFVLFLSIYLGKND